MKFCVHCGKPLPQQSTVATGGNQKFCKTCGTRLDAASGRCPKCQGGKKETSDKKGVKTLLIVMLCLILLVALVGGVMLALDFFGTDDTSDGPRWTEAPEKETEKRPEFFRETEAAATEAPAMEVPATEDPADEAFRDAEEFCKENDAQGNYKDIVIYLKRLISTYPGDPRFQELMDKYEGGLKQQTLMATEIRIEEGRFKEAAEYIQDIQQVYDCDEFHELLTICRYYLSKPLSGCTVIEDTNHSTTSSDVCPGNWEDVTGIVHGDSVRYWVINKAGYQNTEYAVYRLDKEYKTMSAEIVTEINSDPGSDAVIMIYLDGVLAYTSPTVYSGSGAEYIELDITGVSEIKVLCTTDSPSFNYCIVDAILYEI